MGQTPASVEGSSPRERRCVHESGPDASPGRVLSARAKEPGWGSGHSFFSEYSPRKRSRTSCPPQPPGPAECARGHTRSPVQARGTGGGVAEKHSV